MSTYSKLLEYVSRKISQGEGPGASGGVFF